MTTELTDFVFGWRGFLVGTRRGWHAHHRSALVGRRGGHLLARPAWTGHRVRSASALLTAVLTRGGHVWVFGLGRRSDPVWGLARPDWRPGRLSNYLVARLRRVHLTRRLTVTLAGRARPRRRRPSARVSTRAGRGRAHPGGRVVPWGRSVTRTTGSVLLLFAFVRAPRAAQTRAPRFRAWWSTRAAAPPGRTTRVSSTPPGRPRLRNVQHPRTGTPPTRVATGVATGVATRPVRPTRVGTPVPTRVATRFVRWDNYPATLVAGGLSLLKATLLTEVSAAGVPFVRWGGTSLFEGVTPHEVLWNESVPAGGGVPALVGYLHGGSTRAALFRTCLRRLARLAER